MTPLIRVTGTATPYPEPNIDTDVIIRIERLTERADLRHYAFEAIRYGDDGTPDPDCVFNQPRFRDAPILLAGKNFGCGSSREGAVTAIMALGFRVVIAPSFGDIFYANCFKNGMLPIRLPIETIERLAAQTGNGDFTVDLDACTIAASDGTLLNFEIDALSREGLMRGLDDIALTLARADAIAQWQNEDRLARPWVWIGGDMKRMTDDHAA